MNTAWNTQTLGDIAARLPKAAELFRARQIDYCCGGRRTLGDALAELGEDGQDVYAELERLAAQKAQAAEGGFRNMQAGELASYIEGQHHSYLREALPGIGEVFSVVLKAHGARHPSLFELHGLFGGLRTDLEQHLVKEELLLFPALGAWAADETVRLAREIAAEHTAAGAVLARMRSLTGGYAPPADACMTYRRLLEALEELEGDLFQHIHLENNILLKDLLQRGE